MVAMWSAQLSVIYHLGFGRHSTCVGRPFILSETRMSSGDRRRKERAVSAVASTRHRNGGRGGPASHTPGVAGSAQLVSS